MTIALAAFRAADRPFQGPGRRRGRQLLSFDITQAATDLTIDLGDYTGAFWTAVGATQKGADILALVKSIVLNTAGLVSVHSEALEKLQAVTGSAVRSLVTLLPGTVAAGSATPSAVVTGLLTTDTILGVRQIVKNANSLPLIGSSLACSVADALGLVYSADPGASGTISVAVQRATTALIAGQYGKVSIANHLPKITFFTAAAPTAWTLDIELSLNDGIAPVVQEYSANNT